MISYLPTYEVISSGKPESNLCELHNDTDAADSIEDLNARRCAERKNPRVEVMKIAENPKLDTPIRVHRLAIRGTPQFQLSKRALANAERHRGTVFVSFIVVLVMGSIWILIRRRGVDESGNENAVSTRRSYRDHDSLSLVYIYICQYISQLFHCKMQCIKNSKFSIIIIWIFNRKYIFSIISCVFRILLLLLRILSFSVSLFFYNIIYSHIVIVL